MQIRSLKYVSNMKSLTKIARRLPRRWYSKKNKDKEEKEKDVCVSPQAEKHPPVYEGGVDMTDRGIYAADPCDSLKAFPQPRVVIVGAGMAGISAAARLAHHGITDIVVLEAYERPGGRIHSCWIGDCVAELGAHWWDMNVNYEPHPIFAMLSNEKPPKPAYPGHYHTRGLFNNVLSNTMAYTPSIQAYKRYYDIEREARRLFLLGGAKLHGTLLNFMSVRVQQELSQFPKEQQYDAARIMFGLMHMFHARSDVDLEMMCSDHFGVYMCLPTIRMRVPLGLIALLAPMLRDIPEGCIRYCTPVNCIYWGTSQKCGYRAIVVSQCGEEFPCDYVIVTVSLGVLCNYAASLFCPALPATKMDVLRCYGFGAVNKIFLYYETPLWAWQTTNLNIKFDKELKGRRDWTKGITAIHRVPSSKSVICVWIAGTEAVIMEGICDKDVAEGITDLLRAVTGCKHIPYPTQILKSQWYSDPFFKGAFSFEKKDSDGEAPSSLSCPIPGPGESVPPILLFAGEATVAGHLASVAGAKLSGMREADRIAQLTVQYKGPPIPADERCRIFYKSKPCKKEIQLKDRYLSAMLNQAEPDQKP